MPAPAPTAGADGLDAKRYRQVTLSGTRLADEMHYLVAIDEVEPGQSHDAVAVERWLEGEIEARQRLDAGEPGHLQRRFDPAAFANGDLLGEQHIDRLDSADLAALELLNNLIERLQRAWHAQADQVTSDPLDRRRGQRVTSHAAASFAARRLPTAS